MFHLNQYYYFRKFNGKGVTERDGLTGFVAEGLCSREIDTRPERFYRVKIKTRR